MTSHPPITRRHVSADYCSVAEASRLLSVSVSTVRRLISAGTLPAKRVGGQLRVPLQGLRDLPLVEPEEPA